MPSSHEPIECSVPMLTRNNAKNIGPCLEAIRDFKEVIIQDGMSTDGTREIIQSFPNTILMDQDPRYLDEDGRVSNFSLMRNIAINKCTYDWIFVVDTGEVMPKEMLDAIRELIKGPPGVYQAFRRFYVDGERIAWCSGYPALQNRLFHRSCTSGYEKALHEHLVLHPGVVKQMLPVELPEDMPSKADTRRKYAYYRQLELKRLGARSWGDWFKHSLYRNTRSAIILTLRTLWIWLTPRKGKRMPLFYEYIYIKQLFLITWDLCPPVARWKVARMRAQKSIR